MGDQHLTPIFAAGASGLVFWVAGIPFMLFVILYWSKHELDDESNTVYFGFWYKGIRKRMWYFELMNILTKSLTIAGSIFFKSFALKVGVGLFFMLYLTDYVIKNKPM